jgi:hypothetical protein
METALEPTPRFCQDEELVHYESRRMAAEEKASEIISQLNEEELAEVQEAWGLIEFTYPHFRIGASPIEGEDYEEKRSKFKPVIDLLEIGLEKLDKYFPEEAPVFHKFTPGMYIREIHIPADTIFTSATHKTQHPFVISKGVCDICNEVGEVQRLSAPHTGITMPGTRRIFMVHKDLVLTTFHATNLTDPDEWLLENTLSENERLPDKVAFKCFTNKKLN